MIFVLRVYLGRFEASELDKLALGSARRKSSEDAVVSPTEPATDFLVLSWPRRRWRRRRRRGIGGWLGWRLVFIGRLGFLRGLRPLGLLDFVLPRVHGLVDPLISLPFVAGSGSFMVAVNLCSFAEEQIQVNHGVVVIRPQIDCLVQRLHAVFDQGQVVCSQLGAK